MEMIKMSAGKLRAIGYQPQTRVLRVELDDGSALEYANVGESIWRNFKNASAQWSYYRDNIQDEFTAQIALNKVADSENTGKNPLDDLFN